MKAKLSETAIKFLNLLESGEVQKPNKDNIEGIIQSLAKKHGLSLSQGSVEIHDDHAIVYADFEEMPDEENMEGFFDEIENMEGFIDEISNSLPSEQVDYNEIRIELSQD